MPSINPNSAAASAIGGPPAGPIDGGVSSNANHMGSGRSPPERHSAQMMMGGYPPAYPPPPPGYPSYNNAASSPPSDPNKGPPPPHYGFPPGGFPPPGPYGQSYPPYAGNAGYPPYPNRGPWYGGGYGQPPTTGGEGRYPPQVQPSHPPSTSSRSTRGGRAGGKLPYSPPRLNTVVKEESEGSGGGKVSTPEEFGNTKKMDDLEAERLRNAEAAELRLSEVKPIQSEFHLFVADMREKLKEAAEKEVMESLKKKQGKDVSDMDPFLVYTNLNDRLMRAWEQLSREEREVYSGKEEDDRRRFMEEDEVASRHCFTLTARVRAEQRKENTEKGNMEQGTEKEKRPRDDESDDETSAKKIRLNEDVEVAKV